MIAHYHSGDDNRWLVPHAVNHIKAIWLTSSNFKKLDLALNAMRLERMD